MKKKICLLTIGALTIGAVFCSSCKKSAAVPATFSLTVVLAEGATGTPTDGSHTYNEGQTVHYDYSLEDGYKNLVVAVDGQAAAASGNLVMNQSHSIEVKADKILNISGVWQITIHYLAAKSDCSGWATPADPGPFGVEIVHAGSDLNLTSLDAGNDIQLNGTFHDEDNSFTLTGNCTYTVDINGQTFILDGTITFAGTAGETTLEGEFTVTLNHEGSTCSHGGTFTGDKLD